MRKTALILAVMLVLSAVCPSQAKSGEHTAGTGNQGYIVKLKDTGAEENVPSGSECLRAISGRARLYHADSLSSIFALGNSVAWYTKDCEAALSSLPDDPYASKQWSIAGTDIFYAWDKGYSGRGVRIGVIDSGVDALHEDLQGADIAKGYNVLEDSDDVTDKIGHGTFVSGLLAARRGNGLGIAGFCTDATIVPIKCFGESLETSASYVISAIYSAVDDYHCDVINLSLGIKDDVQYAGAIQALRESVEYAEGKGVIVVSAVGNDGDAVLYYPAAFKCAVGVGAVDSNSAVAAFSQKNDSVYIVAPGVNIAGLGIKAQDAYELGGSGTSFSTPFVTAAAAMLKQYKPEATYYDFATLLRESAVDGGKPGYDSSYGYGSLNYENFLRDMEKYDFKDVSVAYPDIARHWAKQNIRYCVNLGFFNGVTADSFGPDTGMTRAMFVTVLSRTSRQIISGYPNPFSDVESAAWYAQACAWGYAAGIVSGTGDKRFSPDGIITRQEIALILFRYAKQFGLDNGDYDIQNLRNYSDYTQIASWAKPAMAWAYGNELISGRDDGSAGPRDTAKRSEAATMFTRFINIYNIS